MLCQYAKREGGDFREVELPAGIGAKLRGLTGRPRGKKRNMVNLQPYVKGIGLVACVKLPGGWIFDPALLQVGLQPWRHQSDGFGAAQEVARHG